MGHFPGSLNLTEAVFQDIDNFKHSEPWNKALEQQCKNNISGHVIDHKAAESLERLLVAFLVLSIVTNAVSFYVLIRTGSIIHVFSSMILGFDTMLLFTSLSLCFIAMSYEVGPYLENIPLKDFSDIQMVGPGFWALLGVVILRILTNPNLVWGTIPILIPVACVFCYLIHMKGFFTLVRTAVLTDLSRMTTT